MLFVFATGISVNSVAELQVPYLQSQLPDADSRTSLPVITIRKSSDAQALPTTTTIVLQHSPVHSVLPQASPTFSPSSRPSPTPHASDHASHRLSVLKSKIGRISTPPAVVFKDIKPDQDTAVSHSVPPKGHSHSKRPTSAQKHKSAAPEDPCQHPMRARSPPAAHETSSSGWLDAYQSRSQSTYCIQCTQGMNCHDLLL